MHSTNHNTNPVIISYHIITNNLKVHSTQHYTNTAMIPSQFTHESRLTLLEAEGVELREQLLQGSEPREGDVERKGRVWWRRTGGAGGEADRGSSRGRRRHVVQRR
jgi:hypothetical protein